MSFTLLALAGCQSMPKVAQETPNQAFSAETESGEAQERLNQINFKQLKKEQNRPIIALVLGSGGARGYAHIGAIQVLEQSGIRPTLSWEPVPAVSSDHCMQVVKMPIKFVILR